LTYQVKELAVNTKEKSAGKKRGKNGVTQPFHSRNRDILRCQGSSRGEKQAWSGSKGRLVWEITVKGTGWPVRSTPRGKRKVYKKKKKRFKRDTVLVM